MPSRLLRVPSRSNRIQLWGAPPFFTKSAAVPLSRETATSRVPSLSRSATATPRQAPGVVRSGPTFADRSSIRPWPVFRYRKQPSSYFAPGL